MGNTPKYVPSEALSFGITSHDFRQEIKVVEGVIAVVIRKFKENVGRALSLLFFSYFFA